MARLFYEHWCKNDFIGQTYLFFFSFNYCFIRFQIFVIKHCFCSNLLKNITLVSLSLSFFPSSNNKSINWHSPVWAKTTKDDTLFLLFLSFNPFHIQWQTYHYRCKRGPKSAFSETRFAIIRDSVPDIVHHFPCCGFWGSSLTAHYSFFFSF